MPAPSPNQRLYSDGARADHTWSARFDLGRPHTRTEVLQKLGGLVASFADPEWPISGAILGSGEEQDRTTLVLGLDPSRSFGTPSVDRCNEIATRITDPETGLGWTGGPEELDAMRVILGRRIGYDGAEYTMEEVRGLTIAYGCGDLTLVEADLFSLRYRPNEGVKDYYEPGVIVTGSASRLAQLEQVAAAMGQERFVSEIPGAGTQVHERNRT